MKRGAPPDKTGVLHRLLPTEFHDSQAELISKGYHSLVPGLISFIRDGMGLLNIQSERSISQLLRIVGRKNLEYMFIRHSYTQMVNNVLLK